MEEEGHTSQECTDHPKTDDDKQPNKIPELSKRKSHRSRFDLNSDYPSRQKSDKAIEKVGLQHQMLELERQWKLLRADGGSQSDDCTLTKVAG